MIEYYPDTDNVFTDRTLFNDIFILVSTQRFHISPTTWKIVIKQQLNYIFNKWMMNKMSMWLDYLHRQTKKQHFDIKSYSLLVWSRFCLFIFDWFRFNFWKKNRDLDFNADFSVTTFTNFWSVRNTTIPEVFTSFVNKNRGCDNGGNNNSLWSLKHTINVFLLKCNIWVTITK